MGMDEDMRRAMYTETRDGGRWHNRPLVEDMLAYACPKCGVAAGEWCKRSVREFKSRQDRALVLAGTPRSHQERKLVAQGHDDPAVVRQRERARSRAAARAREGSVSLADVAAALGVSEAEAQTIAARALKSYNRNGRKTGTRTAVRPLDEGTARQLAAMAAAPVVDDTDPAMAALLADETGA